MEIKIDATQLQGLIADINRASSAATGPAIAAGTRAVLDQAKQKARDAYASHPNKGFQYVGRQFGYDTKVHGASVDAEFGPDKPKGALANVAIFGTSRGGGGLPHPVELVDSDKVVDIFDDVLNEIAGDLGA